MIKFECETCFQEYKVRDDRAGQVLKCKSCGEKMRVPKADDDFEDELYEERPRPTRKKKSAGSTKKKKAANANNPITIIAGVCAFGIAFFVAFTLVSGLFGDKKQNEIVQNEPVEPTTTNTNSANTAEEIVKNDDPVKVTPVETTKPTGLSTNEELKQLRAEMSDLLEAGKNSTSDKEKQIIVGKMKTTQARIKVLMDKQKATVAAQGGTPSPTPKAANVKKPLEQSWTSMVNPSTVVAEWPESSRLKIDLKNMERELIRPNSLSPFIGLRHRNNKFYRIDFWNLVTQKNVGQITITPQKDWIVLSPKFKLSADGKFLLLTFLIKDTKVPMLACWNVTTGEKVAEWEADLAKSIVSLYEICGTQYAFAKMIRKEGTKYKTILKSWDLATGKLLHELEAKSNEFYDTNYKISPGGKYLISHTSNKILFYDLESLKLIYQTELDLFLSANDGYQSLETTDFSADGTELGLLVTTADSTAVWIVNLESGKVTRNYRVPGNLRNVFSEPSYRGNNLVLTPSGNSFLLYGALLVNRQSQRNSWLYLPVPNVIIRNDLFVTPHYLLAGTDSALRDKNGRLRLKTKPKLVSVPLPEMKITESLAANNSQSDAILSAGKKVSIDVKIGKVKFSNVEEVKSILRDVIQERLESEGFEVVPDQPITFKLEYAEQDGNTLQLTKRGKPGIGNPLGRTATGKTLQSTAGAFKLSWIENKPKRTLWSKQALVNPRFLILRDATAEEARKQMFEGLQNRLMAEAIPYFIPQDKNLSMLPGETQLPE